MYKGKFVPNLLAVLISAAFSQQILACECVDRIRILSDDYSYSVSNYLNYVPMGAGFRDVELGLSSLLKASEECEEYMLQLSAEERSVIDVYYAVVNIVERLKAIDRFVNASMHKPKLDTNDVSVFKVFHENYEKSLKKLEDLCPLEMLSSEK